MSVYASTAASVEISIKTGSNPTCMGDLVTFNATPTNGGTSPTYVWKIGTVAVGTGASYTADNFTDGQVVTCEITSNDAWVIQKTATSNPITMKVYSIAPSVTIALTSGSNPSISGQSLTFTATPINGGSSPSYQWKVDGSDVGDSRPTFTSTYLTNGQIVSCDVISSSSCASPTKATSNTIRMNVNFRVGNQVISANELIKVYPNPFANEIIIEFDGNTNKIDFEILNSLGQTILNGILVDKNVIKTAHFTPGIYLIKFKSGLTSEFRKIVKN
jgi:hypothetical protein